MYNRVEVVYNTRYEHISAGETSTRQISTGVTEIRTVIPHKILGRSDTLNEISFPVDNGNYVEATRQAIDKFHGSPESRPKTKYIRDTPPREWESWDVSILAVKLYKPDSPGYFHWGADEDIQPEWWVQVKPMARKRGNITGGGVRVNLNPSSGSPRMTPIPLPPIPEVPISDEERSRIFREVANPFHWKNSTIAKWVPTFTEALKYANTIRYYCGGAEIWALPTGYAHPGYAVTSLGYWHYIGS